MIVIDHKAILDKLTGFLTGEISKTEIYEWALSVVVLGEYESLAKNDQLVEKVFQHLLDIEKPKVDIDLTKKILRYFAQCLKAEAVYSVVRYDEILGNKLPADIARGPQQRFARVEKSLASLGWLVMAARIYVLLFVTVSILLNVAIVAKPDLFLGPDEIAATRLEVGKTALAHLIYGVLIVFAMTAKFPSVFFYGFIPAAVWGMFLYWSLAINILLKGNLSLPSILFLVVFIALPPGAAFFVILTQWFNSSKPKDAGPKVG